MNVAQRPQADRDTVSETLQAVGQSIVAYLDLLNTGIADSASYDALRPLMGIHPDDLTDADCAQFTATAKAAQALVDQAAQAGSAIAVSAIASLSQDQLAYEPQADGSVASWLEFTPDGTDRLWFHDGRNTQPLSLPHNSSRILSHRIRQTADGAAVAWCAQDGDHWLVHLARIDSTGILTPIVSESGVRGVNPDIAVDSDGTIHCLYQAEVDGRWRLTHRIARGPALSEAQPVSVPSTSAWDPSLAVIDSGVVAVWSQYQAPRMRLLHSTFDGSAWSTPGEVPLPADGHALHPQVAGDATSWWVSCDVLTSPLLGTTGRTALVPTVELTGTGRFELKPTYLLNTTIAVVRRTDTWSVPKGAPITESSAGAFPSLQVLADGTVWLAYRSLRQLPHRYHLYPALVSYLTDDGWSTPAVLPNSSGGSTPVHLTIADNTCAAWYLADRHQLALRDLLTTGTDSTPATTSREHLDLPAASRISTGSVIGGGDILTATLATPQRVSPVTLAPLADPIAAVATPQESASEVMWGDLHRHSNVSRCGAGLDLGLVDHFRLAEDVLGYDFWGVTDHAEHTSNLHWHVIAKYASAFARPGKHVPMVAYEWTSFRDGHMNVVHSGDRAPIFSSADPHTTTPAQLWEQLAAAELTPDQVTTIPHHPAALQYPTNFSYDNPDYVRLVEVFQAATGSYESDWCARLYHDSVTPGATVIEALNAGHRLGIIASSDHRTASSYIGLFPQTLDRAGVLAALRDRRCFGTTRRGMIPSLRIGTAQMGQVVTLSEATTVEFGGIGAAELAVVELIRDGEVVASSRSADALSGKAFVDVRVRSAAGGPRQWSGSIAVADGAHLVPTMFCHPAIGEFRSNYLSWDLALPERYVGHLEPPGTTTFGVTIEGDQRADVVISAGPCRIASTVGELAERLHSASVPGGELAARPGTGGLHGMRVSDWSGTVDPVVVRAGSWYYTRVTQVDGEMAWSSPIWVD